MPTNLSKCRTHTAPFCSPCLQPATAYLHFHHDCLWCRHEHRIFCHTPDAALLQRQHVQTTAFDLEISLSESTVTETKFSNDVLTHWRMHIFSSRTQFADSLLPRLTEWPKHEQSMPRNNRAWAMPEHPHIFQPYCWRRRVHDILDMNRPTSLLEKWTEWFVLNAVLQQEQYVGQKIIISSLKFISTTMGPFELRALRPQPHWPPLWSATVYSTIIYGTKPYARVHFGSSGQKSASARWPSTRRPSCKLDIWVCL